MPAGQEEVCRSRKINVYLMGCSIQIKQEDEYRIFGTGGRCREYKLRLRQNPAVIGSRLIGERVLRLSK